MLGVTTVTCVATDAAGNSAQASFDVLVQDTTPPAIADVPDPLVIKTGSREGTIVDFASPTALDVVDGAVAVTCSPAGGSHFVPGTTTVTCQAVDQAGNRQEATFSVTVIVTGKISGYVYLDVNNNGVKDPVELPLPNVPVTLGGTMSMTVLTESQPSAFIDARETAGTPERGCAMDNQFKAMTLGEGDWLEHYNFGERGLHANLVSKRLYLARTPPAFEMVRQLTLDDTAQWYSFQSNRTSAMIAEPAEGAGPIEVYTSRFVPVAIGQPGVSLEVPIEGGETYLMHVGGDGDR